MSTVIIDYDSGNLHSAQKAFELVIAQAGLNQTITVTNDIDCVKKAARIVLPGVGAFADCLRGLTAIDGMVEVLNEKVLQQATPFLGICVGLQLLATHGEEKEASTGLGWINGRVRKIDPNQAPHDIELKVPHMGWNTLDVKNPHTLLNDIPTGENGWHAYFVHSYHLLADDDADCVATTNYGEPVTAMLAKDNIAATQFHPEKSQKLGLKLIENFLNWKP